MDDLIVSRSLCVQHVHGVPYHSSFDLSDLRSLVERARRRGYCIAFRWDYIGVATTSLFLLVIADVRPWVVSKYSDLVTYGQRLWSAPMEVSGEGYGRFLDCLLATRLFKHLDTRSSCITDGSHTFYCAKTCWLELLREADEALGREIMGWLTDSLVPADIAAIVCAYVLPADDFFERRLELIRQWQSVNGCVQLK